MNRSIAPAHFVVVTDIALPPVSPAPVAIEALSKQVKGVEALKITLSCVAATEATLEVLLIGRVFGSNA
jgi:hypothetical protein